MKTYFLLIIILFLICFNSLGQCNTDDYKALRALYLSTNGDNWKNKDNWNVQSENPPSNCNLSKFNGVYLDASGRVYLISLGQNNLTGQIPKEIEHLTNLSTLWLNQNNLIGNIPKELGRLIKLERLALSYNNLSGVIPLELYDLQNLKELSIEYNKITGNLSSDFKNFSKLERLLVNNNNFSGPLPSEIGNLLNLREITFHNNNFEGCFPSSFKNLCNKNINFSNNQLLAEWDVFCDKSICNLNIKSNPLCGLDKSKMIPLRDSKKYPYVVKLKGSAINESNSPYEIHFDTGSWTTSIPGGLLDLDKIKVLKENINDPWGNLADLVSGQFILESVDGTPYELNDYVFYATKDKITKKYLSDASSGFTTSILGAFPSIQPYYSPYPSVPYALALKYAPDNMGLGIISDCYDDINRSWGFMKSYLQIGNDSKILDKLNFRTDIPNWHNQQEFHPEAVPGFKVKIKFPDTDKIIETSTLIATVDTGAPEMTLRLGSNNPQDEAPFSSHFVKEGPWLNWNSNEYLANAKSLKNATVSVEFTDSQGLENSYEFPVGNNVYSTPTALISGKWTGGVPYPLNSPNGPPNRINLGNTVYFYCPVYFWDIKNKRVGVGFKNECQLVTKINTINGTSFCAENSVNISAETIGINAPYTYKWKQGNNVEGVKDVLSVSKAGTYTVEVSDKIGCKASASVVITQTPNLPVNITGTSTICLGQSTALTANIIGGISPFTFTWKKDSTTTGTNANTLTIASGGNYSVTIRDSKGCSGISESHFVIQKTSPDVTISKSGVTDLLTGSSVTLSVPMLSGQIYQWFKNNSAISGAINNSYTLKDAGVYSVVVEGNGCSATSEKVTVSIILANEVLNESKSFKVFPNPVENAFRVVISEPLYKVAEFSLISSVGLVVKDWKVSQLDNTFNIRGLASGVYILKSKINDKVYYLKIIKQD